MIVNLKKMLKNVPVNIKSKVQILENIAYVKNVDGWSIEAYSPVFKDITVTSSKSPKGCQRGDIISIKVDCPGYNVFELVENVTLKQEIQAFEHGILGKHLNVSEMEQFLQWREKQLKQKKR